jgi:hypothetical protein
MSTVRTSEGYVGGHVHISQGDGADVSSLSYVVLCVVVTLARFGIGLALSVQKMLNAYGMMPDVGARTEASFLHELVEFASLPLLRGHVSNSLQVLVLKGGLNN